MYCWSQLSLICKLRAIPAQGIFSSSIRSSRDFVSSPIRLHFGFSTNCRPQARHLSFWLPCRVVPCLLRSWEPQVGHCSSGLTILSKKTNLLLYSRSLFFLHPSLNGTTHISSASASSTYFATLTEVDSSCFNKTRFTCSR